MTDKKENKAQIPSLSVEWRKTEGPLYTKRELAAFERYVTKMGFEATEDEDYLGFRAYIRASDGASILVYLDELGEEGQKNSGTVLVCADGESNLTSIWDFLKDTRWSRLGMAFKSAGQGIADAAHSAGKSIKSIFSKSKKDTFKP